MIRLLISREQRKRQRKSGTISRSKTITTETTELPSKRPYLHMPELMAATLMRFPRPRRLSSRKNSIRLTKTTTVTSLSKILLTCTQLNTKKWLNKALPSSDLCKIDIPLCLSYL